MAEFSLYADWINSHEYLLLNSNVNNVHFEFVDLLLSVITPAIASKIIQVGSGTGQMSSFIAEKGLDVTGVDFSNEMINLAKGLEKENLHFYQHDVRLPFWINYFDYALNLFNSFGHYNTLREHDNAVRTISQALKPNGLFVMDYLNVHFEEANMVETEEIAINDEQFQITRWQDDENFFKKIQVKQEGGVTELFTEKFMKLSIGDLTDMFAYQGLQIQEVFGDYKLGNYDIRKSPRLIFIAKKIRR